MGDDRHRGPGDARPVGCDGPAQAGRQGAPTPAAGIPSELLDALLAVANKALECGYDDELNLALIISDTVLAQRKNSRAGLAAARPAPGGPR